MLFFEFQSILSFFYLQMSQKRCTFALVIELERHIEILLLSNDCVIVPDLGGFMAHHLEARYDDEECMFLPPQRTLGFNPQLKLNDSLLAQSYVEAYDISYPEAIRRIEAEVAEVRQYLDNEGYYELNDLGRLEVNQEGNLEFEPCEAGILTPGLYGLSSFEMKPLNGTVPAVSHKKAQVPKLIEISTEPVENTTDEHEGRERAITITMSWIRNTVAVAAALLAFFIMTKPVSNGGQSNVTMSQINLPILQKDTDTKAMPKLDKQTVQEALTKHEVATEAPVTPKVEETPAAEVAEPEPQPENGYCIVVASQVSQRNAEEFAKKLRGQGFGDARVHIHKNIRRVICGLYPTEAEAYRQLKAVQQHEGLAEAWVYHVK